MTLRNIRIIQTLLLSIIVYLKNWTLLPYWSAMLVSLEILNHNKRYLQQAHYKLYNAFFIGYTMLVVWDRTRTYRVGEAIEWSFNSLMHIFFGLIVCFKISQYLVVFDKHIKHRILFIALFFNVLGVFNEYLQNFMSQRDLWVLISDARKDMMMNVIGTLVFIVVEYFLSRKRS